MGNICNVVPLQSKETKLEGYAPELTSAKAFSLLNNSPISNNSPYLFKKSGAVGLERLKDIVGASYVNNQLVDTNTTSVTIASGHKYVAKISGTLSVGQSSGSAISVTGGTDTFTDLTQMFGSASIADYIYSLETATAGAGIAKLKELGFDFSTYRAYDAGSIVSVNTSGLKVVGKNLYNKADTTLEYNYYIDGNSKLASWNVAKTIIIPCLPNTQYTISKVSSTRFACGYLTGAIEAGASVYGLVTNNPATSITVTTTENAKYLVAFVYNSNADTLTFDAIKDSLQIELGSTATPYEPYTSKTTPLSPIDLRGLYKIDANNNIYADGDEYKSDGDVSRKYGIVDLGTLDWTYNPDYKYFYAQLAGRKQVLNSCISEIYTTIDSSLDGNSDDMRIKLPANSDRVFITNNAYTVATTFKTAMSGVYLVYELATPTAETAKPYPEYINIYQGGTEEFIDERTLSAPVGHDSDLFEVMTFDDIVDAVVSRLSNRSVRETPQEETTEEPTEDDVR